jgi:hypothetical protein
LYAGRCVAKILDGGVRAGFRPRQGASHEMPSPAGNFVIDHRFHKASAGAAIAALKLPAAEP